MPVVDRNLLRIAAYEMLWLKTPAANGAIVRVGWTAGKLRLLAPPSVAHLAPLGSEGVTLGSAGGPGPVA